MMTLEVRSTAPDFRVIAIDESEYITDPAILEKAGRVFGVYMYDKNEVTHCCEITPSYCLYPLYNSWEKSGDDYYEEHEAERDEIEDDLRLRDYDVTYMYCYSVDALEQKLKGEQFRYHILGDFGGREGMTDEQYNELRDRAEEYCRCNWLAG